MVELIYFRVHMWVKIDVVKNVNCIQTIRSLGGGTALNYWHILEKGRNQSIANNTRTRTKKKDHKSTMNCFINFSISSSSTSSLSIAVSSMSHIDTHMLENTFAFLSAISSFEAMWRSIIVSVSNTDWYGSKPVVGVASDAAPSMDYLSEYHV